MNQPIFMIRWFQRLTVLGGLLLCADAIAQSITNVEEAYQYLTSKSSTFPNDFTPKDQESIAVFRIFPAEAKALLVKKILAGEQKEPGVNKFLIALGREDGRDVMREVVSHYQYGDLSTPFTGFLAYHGSAQDMERLKKLITLYPDREGIAGMAVLMVESDNPNAHAALLELRDTALGKWQERREIKEFFAMSDRRAESADLRTTSISPAQPANTSVKSKAPDTRPAASSTIVATTNSTNWWRWVGAVAVLGALIVFLILRRK